MNSKQKGPLSQQEGRAKGCVWHGPEGGELGTARAQEDENPTGEGEYDSCQRFAGTLSQGPGPSTEDPESRQKQLPRAFILLREMET